MTVCIRDIAHDNRYVRFSNKGFTRLCERGVFLPAGLYAAGEWTYFSDRHPDGVTLDTFRATPAEAVACAMAMRAYADSVRYGVASRRGWVDDRDKMLAEVADATILFLLDCGGFRVT